MLPPYSLPKESVSCRFTKTEANKLQIEKERNKVSFLINS